MTITWAILARLLLWTASLFSGLTWLLQWPYLAMHWVTKRLTIAGVNARARMNGVYKP